MISLETSTRLIVIPAFAGMTGKNIAAEVAP